jgi:hypothetical protein
VISALRFTAPFLLSLPVLPLGAAPPAPADVDKAIARGNAFLLQNVEPSLKTFDWPGQTQTKAPLMLYALAKGNADPRHPAFLKLLDHCLKEEIRSTYQASTLALALHAIDPGRFQQPIWRCGQFLLDNQCKNGQWGYGKPVTLPTITLSASSRRVVTQSGSRSGGGTQAVAAAEETRPKRELKLQARAAGPDSGDNSNTQYALLGLRACEEANVRIPADAWKRALDAWLNSQKGDGGWNYENGAEASYPSMTEGGLGSLVIAMHYLDRDWRKDERVAKAIAWMKAFDVKENRIPRHQGNAYHYYHLYALERAGMLAQLEQFGGRDWYDEGAAYLLKVQGANGSWKSGSFADNDVQDTCYAILFLRRATQKLPPKVYTN